MIKKILVLDDEVDLLSFLKYYIESKGIEVRCCSNLEAAIKSLTSESFDLIISDWVMPEGSGADLAKWLLEKKDMNLPKLYILSANANYDEEIVKHPGVCGVFEKPIDFIKFDAILA